MLVEGDIKVKPYKELPFIGEILIGVYPDNTRVECVIREILKLEWIDKHLIITVSAQTDPIINDIKRYESEILNIFNTKEERD